MSQEYIGAIVILLISVAKIFGIELASEDLTAFITSAIAIWVAIRRYSRGDITPFGARK